MAGWYSALIVLERLVAGTELRAEGEYLGLVRVKAWPEGVDFQVASEAKERAKEKWALDHPA